MWEGWVWGNTVDDFYTVWGTPLYHDYMHSGETRHPIWFSLCTARLRFYFFKRTNPNNTFQLFKDCLVTGQAMTDASIISPSKPIILSQLGGFEWQNDDEWEFLIPKYKLIKFIGIFWYVGWDKTKFGSFLMTKPPKNAEQTASVTI